MYNIVPLVIILISLIVIIVIIARKFSILAALDVENIPSEKEGRFKEKIAGKRIKRNFSKISSKLEVLFGSVYKKLGAKGRDYYEKLNELKDDYGKKIVTKKESEQERAERLMEELKTMDPKESFEKYENNLIEVIGIDNKNSTAFEKLGDLYFDNKRYKEARETYNYLLNLLSDDEVGRQAQIYCDLALLDKEEEKNEEALENIKKALSLAPNNPRYLDIMFELGIILQDKNLAREAFDKLSEVNPENQKLPEFEKQLKELE